MRKIIKKIGMRGKLVVIALSMVLVLASVGVYLSPVYGGGGSFFTFDGDTDQDWNTATNWNPDGIPQGQLGDIMEIGTASAGPTFDVNINSPLLVQIELGGGLQIFSGNTLTIKSGATLDHFSAETIIVDSGATLTVDGTLNNIFGASMTVNGLIVVTGTGSFTNDVFSSINGVGTIQCTVPGVFDDQGTTAGTITVTGCQAPVGSTSIPIESASLLVADTQSFSWMIPVLLSGIGIGLFVVSRKSE